jgi:hypothetical protein
MTIEASIIIAISVMIIFLSAWIIPKTRLQKLVNDVQQDDGTFKRVESARSIDWMKGTALGDHWLIFNIVSALSSVIIAVIVAISPLGAQLMSKDHVMWMFFLMTAAMFGYHLIWSSSLDWRFHKIPRWVMVFHMAIILAASIYATVNSTSFQWVTLSVIIVSIMCWLIGTVPGSGMSDGRLYVIIAAGAVPFLSTAAIWPTLLAGGLAVVNAVIVAVGPGKRLDRGDTKKPIINRIMKAGSPMGPFVIVSFTIGLILVSYMIWGSPSVSILNGSLS